MIHSIEPNDFMYGKFEIRCKIPSSSLWPAFWLFGEDGTEIDIFEFLFEGPSNDQLGIIKWGPGGVIIGYDNHDYLGTNLSTDFHIYTLERDPWFLTFKIDNIEVWKVNKFYQLNGTAVTWCDVIAGTYAIHSGWPTGPTHVIANLAVGGPTPSQISFPQNMEIDYIRVYQRTPQAGFYDLCSQNQITGNAQICGQGVYTYHFSGPNIGFLNSWSSSPNITIISSTSSSVTIKALNSTINGSGWIKAAFTPLAPCTVSNITKSIWIGKPQTPAVLAQNKPCDECITFRILNNANTGASFAWNIGGHNFTGSPVLYCDQISIPFGFVDYTVTATNSCGSAASNGTAEYEVCDNLLNLFPNPVSEYLNLHFDDDRILENLKSVELINPDGIILKTFDSYNIPSGIDVTSFKTGFYTIVVEFKTGKRFTKTISIIHK